MPCKEVTCVVDERIKSSKKEQFRPECVEELVAAIKHNLQLKARPCHVLNGKQRRSSPYNVPLRTVSRPTSCNSTSSPMNSSEFPYTCRNCAKSESTHSACAITNPYDLLQELLKNGNLIKEAVSRLAYQHKKKIDFYDSDSEEACRCPVAFDL